MRIKRNRLQTCYHRAAIARKDGEGNSYLEYDPSSSIDVVIWPAGGKIQAARYGQRLTYIKNCRIDSEYMEVANCDKVTCYQLMDGTIIQEGDGICVSRQRNAQPDYRIISIKPYRYLALELERMT